MGGFMFCIFSTYSYAFFMGSVWVYKQFYSPTFGRAYTAGDILSCFFGIIFGMFSLGLAGPNIKAIAEGKVAAKMAFDVIENQPKIN